MVTLESMRPRIKGVAWRYATLVDIEDAIQVGMWGVHKAWLKLPADADDEYKIKAGLRAAASHIIDLVRAERGRMRGGRSNKVDIVYTDELPDRLQPFDSANDPCERLLLKERIATVIGALQCLPERDRQVMDALYAGDGSTVEMVAERFGVTTSRIHQIRKRVIQQLQQLVDLDEVAAVGRRSFRPTETPPEDIAHLFARDIVRGVGPDILRNEACL